MKFLEEPLTKCRHEMADLLDQHYEELTLNKHIVKLDPDWDRYAKLENEGKLVTYSIRSDSGELCGYSIFFVDTHIHYKSLVVATNDVIFLRKDLRSGMTGIKFLKYCDHELSKRPIHKIVWHIKDSINFAPILGRIGYKKEDTLVARLI